MTTADPAAVPAVHDDTDSRTATIAWLIAAIGGFAGFTLLAGLVWAHVAIPFDEPIRLAATSLRPYFPVWNAISEAANYPLIVIGLGIVAWLFWKHRRREAVLVFLVLASATAGSEVVKQLTHRERPPGSDTVVPGVIYSFPSGHTVEAVTIFGIITLLVWRSGASRRLKLGLLVAVVLYVCAVMLARVAINAHFASDVLAGLLGGIGVLATFALLTRDERRDTATR
jgi:membrane-associated phospholipid phosphatase